MKKDYPIKIGGKTFKLRFNFAALTAVEDASGKSFFEVLAQTGKGHLGSLRMILHAGLMKYHDLTAEAVGELIDEADDFAPLFKGVSDAVGNYFTKGKDAKKKNPEPMEPGSPIATEPLPFTE